MLRTLSKYGERNDLSVSGSPSYMDSHSTIFSKSSIQEDVSPQFVFRPPEATDGSDVAQLVKVCKPLDENSLYCNLLQCSHFQDTCVLAESDGAIAGFISGYRLPQQPNTLFVWQVAVHPQFRGMGLASRMLSSLLQRQNHIQYLHTTITADNEASWQTFRRFASNLGAELNTQMMFSKEQHFANQHDSEELVVIGPFNFFSESESEESSS